MEKKTESKEKIALKGCIPARYILTFLTFWGMCLIFAHRVCLNVAMVAMVNSSAEPDLPYHEENNKNSTDDVLTDYQCPLPEDSSNVTFNYRKGTFPWTPSTQGLILASYFYGYVFTQIIGGRLADFCGPKWLFGGGTLISSCLTLLTPIVANLENAAVYLIILRIFLGLSHGMNYPSAYTMFARWAPIQERSTMLSLCVIGTHFGVVLSMMLTGYLCEYGFAGGWPSAFYVLGVCGIIWFFFWAFLVFSTPAEHPRISVEELNYIYSNLPPMSNEKKNLSTPWLKVALSPPIWAVTIAKFTGSWSFICFQTKLPAYLDEVLHLPIQKNGMVNALLFGALCISVVSSGFASDIIRVKGVLRTTTIRKIFETFALVGPALCLVAIPQMGCNADGVIILLTSSMALFGLCGGGDVSVIVDLAPDFAGKIFGVSNAIASVPGILAPIVAGAFLEGNKGDFRQWTNIFYVSVGTYIFGAFVFLLFGSAETQSWGIAQSKSDDMEKGCRKESTKGDNLKSTVSLIILSPEDLFTDNLKKVY